VYAQWLLPKDRSVIPRFWASFQPIHSSIYRRATAKHLRNWRWRNRTRNKGRVKVRGRQKWGDVLHRWHFSQQCRWREPSPHPGRSVHLPREAWLQAQVGEMRVPTYLHWDLGHIVSKDGIQPVPSKVEATCCKCSTTSKCMAAQVIFGSDQLLWEIYPKLGHYIAPLECLTASQQRGHLTVLDISKMSRTRSLQHVSLLTMNLAYQSP